MASIVSCPGCQKRLKIGTDKPGGKLRCPGCATPFVLGSRTNTGAGGTPEFQAFELFEDNIVTDTFEIEEEVPASRFKPLPKSAPPSAPRLAAPPAPTPKPAVRPPQPQPALFEDDLDLLEEGPPRPRPPKPAPPPPPQEQSILPDNFGLVEEKPAPKPPPKPPAPPPARPAPRHAPSHSEKPSSAADFVIEPVAERKSTVRPAPPPPPPAPAAKSTDFFLPADFDPFAPGAPGPPKPAVPDLSLDDDLPRLEDEPDPTQVHADFDIVEEPVRRASDGVAVVEGVTDREAAEIAAARPQFDELEEVDDLDIADRRPRRAQRQARARKSRINADVRGRWLIVHWGLTVELIALALMVLSMVLGAVGGVLGLLMRSPAGVGVMGIFIFLSLGLMVFREVLVVLGYGLCIAAPARNNAWIWAVLALAFAFAAMFGYIVAFIFPPAFLLMPLSLMSWFFYLIYLKSLGDALKIHYIADEAMQIMKLLGLQFMMTLLFWGGIIGLLLIVGKPKTDMDLDLMGWLFLSCEAVFGIISLIMIIAIIYKYYYVLLNLRLEIGWRLES